MIKAWKEGELEQIPSNSIYKITKKIVSENNKSE